MAKATCVVKSLVKLSQFFYDFKDVRKYRKSSMDACDKMADHLLEAQRQRDCKDSTIDTHLQSSTLPHSSANDRTDLQTICVLPHRRSAYCHAGTSELPRLPAENLCGMSAEQGQLSVSSTVYSIFNIHYSSAPCAMHTRTCCPMQHYTYKKTLGYCQSDM